MPDPSCNYAVLQAGSATNGVSNWVGGDATTENKNLPVASCVRFPGVANKYAKILCTDNTAGSAVKLYQYSDMAACEADATGDASNEYPVADDAVVKTVTGGKCDQSDCVHGTDFFGFRKADSTTTCAAASLSSTNDDWDIHFTADCLDISAASSSMTCHGTGGVAVNLWTATGCSTGTGTKVATNVAQDECREVTGPPAIFTKYQSTCTAATDAPTTTAAATDAPTTTAAAPVSGASSLNGKIVVGMMAAILTAMAMM